MDCFDKLKFFKPNTHPKEPISLMPKDCLDSHLTPISLWNGKLYGYPGKHMMDHTHSLNVWLADTFCPDVMYTYGLPSKLTLKEAHVLFPITDRNAPCNRESFTKLLNLISSYLKKGKSVAVSCYGGHGRTGLVLACLYGMANPTCVDPIDAIRKLGCSKWVESEVQAKFIFSYLNHPYLPKYNEPQKGFYYGTDVNSDSYYYQGYSHLWK